MSPLLCYASTAFCKSKIGFIFRRLGSPRSGVGERGRGFGPEPTMHADRLAAGVDSLRRFDHPTFDPCPVLKAVLESFPLYLNCRKLTRHISKSTRPLRCFATLLLSSIFYLYFLFLTFILIHISISIFESKSNQAYTTIALRTLACSLCEESTSALISRVYFHKYEGKKICCSTGLKTLIDEYKKGTQSLRYCIGRQKLFFFKPKQKHFTSFSISIILNEKEPKQIRNNIPQGTQVLK